MFILLLFLVFGVGLVGAMVGAWGGGIGGGLAAEPRARTAGTLAGAVLGVPVGIAATIACLVGSMHNDSLGHPLVLCLLAPALVAFGAGAGVSLLSRLADAGLSWVVQGVVSLVAETPKKHTTQE